MIPKIIYESEDLLVLNKPSGLLVHPTIKNEKVTLVEWLLSEYPQIKDVGEPQRPGIVHRLDKETSGLLVVAKNQETYEKLKALFHDRKITKHYYALVWGAITPNNGRIEKEIAAHGGKRATVEPYSQISFSKTRAAITEWEIFKKYKDYTLLSVRPRSGRTHQIRVHLSSIGYPIVCDKLYGGKKKCPPQLDRLFLHAYFLRIPLRENEILEFEEKMPLELENFLKSVS